MSNIPTLPGQVREIAPNSFWVDLPKRDRPRTRKLANGFRVDCAHVLNARYGSPLARALLQADDASNVHWVGTAVDIVSCRVNSLGLKRVRQIMVENAPLPVLQPITTKVRHLNPLMFEAA